MVIDKDLIYYGVPFKALPLKLKESVEALERGDITSAEIITREYLEIESDNEIALRARLKVLSKLRSFQAAVEIVGRLLDIVGDKPELFFEGAYYAELGGNLELALQGYEKVLEVEPLHVDALLGLGRTLLNSPGISGSDAFFARAYELDPEHQDAAEFLALAYEKENNFAVGIPYCEEALSKFPESFNLMTVLANLWGDSGKSAKGLSIALQAIELAPDQAKPYISASYLLDNLHRPFEALEYLEKAFAIAPNDLNISLGKSSLLRVIGRTAESLRDLQQIIRYAPRLANARSNYLFYLHDINGVNRETIYNEHKKFGIGLAPLSLSENVDFLNDLSSERKLVLGFLSSDLKVHSVAYFLYPLLCELDKERFKILLFSNNAFDDEFTDKFKDISDEFVSIRDISDIEAAEFIRKKRVDVLFELNGHTAGNRLLVCSHRAAPVQVNWLGYPDTTGIESMDYRLVDEVTDPEGEADDFATEELLRMPRGFLTYQPPAEVPVVSEAPFISNGYVTFGTFNNFAKINPDMVALWSKLLLDNPDSKLLLKSHALVEEAGKDYVRDCFKNSGVASSRLKLFGTMDSLQEHFEMYSQIDIALDTFPYNGTTTSFEALYMGVPVVTLCGKNHASRVGASIMTHLGLEQLVAQSPQQYLLIAAALAGQQDDLLMLRKSMRERLLKSKLCDNRGYAEDFTKVIFGIWNKWIGSRCQ